MDGRKSVNMKVIKDRSKAIGNVAGRIDVTGRKSVDEQHLNMETNVAKLTQRGVSINQRISKLKTLSILKSIIPSSNRDTSSDLFINQRFINFNPAHKIPQHSPMKNKSICYILRSKQSRKFEILYCL